MAAMSASRSVFTWPSGSCWYSSSMSCSIRGWPGRSPRCRQRTCRSCRRRRRARPPPGGGGDSLKVRASYSVLRPAHALRDAAEISVGSADDLPSRSRPLLAIWVSIASRCLPGGTLAAASVTHWRSVSRLAAARRDGLRAAWSTGDLPALVEVCGSIEHRTWLVFFASYAVAAAPDHSVPWRCGRDVGSRLPQLGAGVELGAAPGRAFAEGVARVGPRRVEAVKCAHRPANPTTDPVSGTQSGRRHALRRATASGRHISRASGGREN